MVIVSGSAIIKLFQGNEEHLKPHMKGRYLSMRKLIYTMCFGNEYDYERAACTTDNVDDAYAWLEAGCKQIAILDACSYEYLGYMDIQDLYERDNYDENC